jgi:hypothetical protein
VRIALTAKVDRVDEPFREKARAPTLGFLEKKKHLLFFLVNFHFENMNVHLVHFAA